MLQAPVLGYRRGRGVLDSRDPLSVTLPLGRDLWGEADAVLAVWNAAAHAADGMGHRQEFADRAHRRRSEQPARLHKPNVALTGNAAPICDRSSMNSPNSTCGGRRDETRCRSGGAKLRQRLNKIAPQPRFSSTRSAPSCRRTASSSTKSRRSALPRASHSRSISHVTFLSPGYQDNLGWGCHRARRAACKAGRTGALDQW